MTQPQQLERLFEIDRQIRAGQYPNAERVAAQMRLSKRVIFNDKRFMVDRLGAPIEFDHARGGWFYTDSAWTPPAMFATEGELLAFFLSVEVACRYAGTACEAPLRAAVDKLSTDLGGHIQVSLDQLSATCAAPVPDDSVSPDLLMALQRAIQERRPVQMRYSTAGRDEWNERTVQPCLLYHLDEHWHVFGYDHLRREMHNFRADRIENLQVMAQAVADPAG